MTAYEKTLKKQQRLLVHRIVSGGSVNPSEKGIAAYQDSYLSRLSGILEHDFPASVAFIGTDTFRRYAKDYLHFCRPNHYKINHIASGFLRFLKSIQLHRQSPILIDLLLFEKEMLEMRHAKERHHAVQYVQIDEQLVECRVLFSHYPIGYIWHSILKKNDYQSSLIYQEKYFIYLFYKIDERVFFQTITQDEWVQIRNYASGYF